MGLNRIEKQPYEICVNCFYTLKPTAERIGGEWQIEGICDCGNSRHRWPWLFAESPQDVTREQLELSGVRCVQPTPKPWR